MPHLIFLILSFALLTRAETPRAPEYIGCFIDKIPRDLAHYFGNNHTLQSCTKICGENNYLYAGLQNRGQCWCDNDYGTYGKCAETHCNRPCKANPMQICGGALRNSIYHSQFMTCIPIGNDCLTEIEIQRCHDHLGGLSLDSITNECVPFVQDNETYYRFALTYHNGYNLDESCLSQTLSVEGNEIPGLLHVNGKFHDGATIYDVLPNQHFTYFSSTHTLEFTLKHTDLENLNCQKFVTDDEYIWQCDFSLHIYFVGIQQYKYTFCMTTTLSRVYTNSLTVTVNPNEVIGDCCENTLEIQTQLKFCSDFTCSSYLADGLTVQRKSDIFVEHSITSSEFQYYYLHGLQIKIGAFLPDIIAQNGSQPGRIIYHLQSNVAFNNMQIEAISRIAETAQRRRNRYLQASQNNNKNTNSDSEIGNNYKVKAINILNVNEKKNAKKDNNKNQSQKEKILIGVIAGIGTLIIVATVFLTYMCIKKQKTKLKLQAYELERQQSSNSPCNNIQINGNNNNNMDMIKQQHIKFSDIPICSRSPSIADKNDLAAQIDEQGDIPSEVPSAGNNTSAVKKPLCSSKNSSPQSSSSK